MHIFIQIEILKIYEVNHLGIEDIITRFYIKKEKLADIAKHYGLSYKQAFKWKKNILKKISSKM